MSATNGMAHDYANLFPMMTQVELEALAADIKENGLRTPIVKYGGKILDGRNRLKACEMVKVKPTFSDYEGDDAGALALVISLNVQRRDLTAAQRAISAAKAMEVMPERRGQPKKGGKSSHIKSRELVSAEFKVSDKSVQQAKAILTDAPDLAAQVESCTLSLAAAYEQLQTRKQDQQRQQEEDARKAREAEKNATLREAVSNGEMTIDEALEKARDEARAEEEKQRHDAEARGIWEAKMLQLCALATEWISTRKDSYLAWYSEPGSPGCVATLTAQQIEEAIAQLNRVRIITFQPRGEDDVSA